MTTNPLQSLQSMWSSENAKFAQGLMAPLLVVAILALMVLPIPPWLRITDILQSFDNSLSLHPVNALE